MFLLFDIGGTKMRLAVSADGNTISEPKIISTPHTFDEGVTAFKRAVEEITKETKAVTVAAGGVAGPLDRDRARLARAPNLPQWAGKPLKEELERILGIPVYMENDTAMVGLGEVHHGAGRGKKIVAYITVSTGVGGTRFVDGHIDVSAFGFEPGHQIIDASGALCPACKKNGFYDLEAYISGSAFERRFGKKPYEIIDSAIWDQAAQWLAYGLNNTVVHWSPDSVVLGGSMITGAPAIPLESIENHLKDIMYIFPVLPSIRKAELGDAGGLWGALMYAKQTLQS